MRQPSLFIAHGGGPCFWMTFPAPMGPHAYDGLRAYLAGLVDALPERPRAFLVVSGHWEAARATVSTNPAPGMLYDYYNFPPHTYELKYPAPGAPDIARDVVGLLRGAGVDIETDGERGFDHGVFVPFLIVDPEATIPVVMMSLREDLDPAAHIAIGAALAPLRDQGVVIVGSGNSFHNLKTFRNGEGRDAGIFDAWLNEAACDPDPARRNAKLIAWSEAPSARAAHPREEHLLPLMVVAGAGGADPGRRVFHDIIGGKAISGFAYG